VAQDGDERSKDPPLTNLIHTNKSYIPEKEN